MLRIGIDTGGTFTDFVVHEDGKMSAFKLPSTSAHPERAVIEGLRKIIARQPSFLVRYGSTVATNALLERKGAKTVLVTNQGFEDILEIGRQNRPGLYSLTSSKPEPLISSKMRVGVKERTLHDGSQLVPLEKKSLDWLAGRMGQLKPESIAVALLYSYLNPDGEKAIEEALRNTGVPISLSHRIHPEFREYERTSATVINAYLTPTMVRYLTALGMDPVMERGKLTIMQSNGGAISGEVARNEPVRTLLSGPAGGVVGAFRIAQQAGFERIITLDMGGTSTDVCLCNGQISITNESEIDHFPVPTPMIPIHTIGAGGGSIAHVDAGGLLRVGPQSAGADPGPVAYGRGRKITVTDARIHLGHLHPEFFLGGEMTLRPRRIAPALDALTAKLNQAGKTRMTPDEVAEGIIEITNTQMENAIRVISLQKGYDTRSFTLVCFGGSGGLHACRLARSLMIGRVLIPPDPGLVSASGVLGSDIIKDASRTVLLLSDDDQAETVIDRIYTELEAQVIALMSTEGFSGDQVGLVRSMDVRYRGQSYELNVEYSSDYEEDFHSLHEQYYGYANPALGVEVVTLRVRATGLSEPPEIARHPMASEYPPSEALLQEKHIRLDGRETPTRFYVRQRLLPGNRLRGPAVIVEYSSTTLLPEGFEARVDEWKNLVLLDRG